MVISAFSLTSHKKFMHENFNRAKNETCPQTSNWDVASGKEDDVS